MIVLKYAVFVIGDVHSQIFLVLLTPDHRQVVYANISIEEVAFDLITDDYMENVRYLVCIDTYRDDV